MRAVTFVDRKESSFTLDGLQGAQEVGHGRQQDGEQYGPLDSG